jgi:hypothetical protein
VIYIKKTGIGPHGEYPNHDWGTLTRYLEIGDDNFAVRHVDVYDNGNILRYDRQHWGDAFDHLAERKYDREKWERRWGPGEVISATDFESVWKAALASPLWPQQAHSASVLNVHGPAPWLS